MMCIFRMLAAFIRIFFLPSHKWMYTELLRSESNDALEMELNRIDTLTECSIVYLRCIECRRRCQTFSLIVHCCKLQPLKLARVSGGLWYSCLSNRAKVSHRIQNIAELRPYVNWNWKTNYGKLNVYIHGSTHVIGEFVFKFPVRMRWSSSFLD